MGQDSPFSIKEISAISFGVAPNVEQEIGRAIVRFARLEHAFELMIWDLLRLDSDNGKIFTARMEMSRKTAVVRQMLTNLKPPKFPTEAVWRALKIATENRNKIAHAVWITVDGDPAMVSSRWSWRW